MKEYEIHVSVAYTTAGGTTEGSYFVEYVAAKNIAEVERILRAELKDAGYKNINLDTNTTWVTAGRARDACS